MADPSKVDDVVGFVRERVLPEVDAQSGSLGLSMNVDRASGRCTVTSVWADRASMHASERALAPLRDAAGRVAAGEPVTEEYELAVLHRLRQAEPGCWVRTTRVRLDPAQVDEAVRTFRRDTVPAVERLPGFRSVLLLVDRRSGHGVVSAVFDDRASLDASRALAGQVRSEASAATSAQVTDVVESEIVIAALRLPLHQASEADPVAQPTSPVS
jgi:quinol monooxygenase YgiN